MEIRYLAAAGALAACVFVPMGALAQTSDEAFPRCSMSERDRASFHEAYGAARLAQVEGRHEVAIDLLQRGIRLCMEPELLHYIAKSHTALGDHERAEAYAKAYAEQVRVREEVASGETRTEVVVAPKQPARVQLGDRARPARPAHTRPPAPLFERRQKKTPARLKLSTKKTSRRTTMKLRAIFDDRPTKVAKGSVSFETMPTGAHVSVDGRHVGVTPLMLHLEAGSHDIVVSKPGWGTMHRRIDVTADRQVRMLWSLVRE